jgi:hypothetical protein
VDVAEALAHGLSHHERGDIDEALWWWQFSYLSGWGGVPGARVKPRPPASW